MNRVGIVASESNICQKIESLRRKVSEDFLGSLPKTSALEVVVGGLMA